MKALRFAVITVSDRSSRGERPDASGPAIKGFIQEHGNVVDYITVIPDEQNRIQEELIKLCDQPDIDVILTSGGTGVAERDATPEATLQVLEKLIPGIPEYIRAKSVLITPHAMLSRGVAGIRKKKIIINLPGSPKGAVESLSFVFDILQHTVAQIKNLPSAQDHNPVLVERDAK